MGEAVIIVEREITKEKRIFSSVCGNAEGADALIDAADRQDGQAVLGKLVAIYCLDAECIPRGNIFGSPGCGVPAGVFERHQLVEALRAQHAGISQS